METKPDPSRPPELNGEHGQDDEEEEEEDEPKLKYQGLPVSQLLKDDSETCIAAHSKFLAIGTAQGNVHILDLAGNPTQCIKVHTQAVRDMTIDDAGESMATCSDDDTVMMVDLYERLTFKHKFSFHLSTVAIDPAYSRNKKSGAFFCAGVTGRVIHMKRGIFGMKDSLVHEGDGPVQLVRWRGSMVAWANSAGVYLYDVRQERRIAFIDGPSSSPHPSLYPGRLVWETNSILLIASANVVKIAHIKERDASMVPGAPYKLVEISTCFTSDEYIVSGIAPMGENLVLLAVSTSSPATPSASSTPTVPSPAHSPFPSRHELTVSPPPTTPVRSPSFPDAKETHTPSRLDSTKLTRTSKPELRIVTRESPPTELSCDIIDIKGASRYTAQQFRLEYIAEDAHYVIMSPHDLVLAGPCGPDDRIDWLLRHNRFSEALAAALDTEPSLRKYKVSDVGEQYVLSLMNQQRWTEAAALLPRVCRTNCDLWNAYIDIFINDDHLTDVVEVVPLSNPQLPKASYDKILRCVLETSPCLFVSLVRSWPSALYSVPEMTKLVKATLKRCPNESPDSVHLLNALAHLYSEHGRHGKSLDIYMKLKTPSMFHYIQQNELFDAVQDKVLAMLEMDRTACLNLLVTNTSRIPIESVVEQIRPQPRLLFLYLRALYEKDSKLDPKYHDMLLPLYAQFDVRALLPFLRASDSIDLEHALRVCESHGLVNETVFVLARIGNTKRALALLLDQPAGPDGHPDDTERAQQAMEFASQQNDAELWHEVINLSLTRPALMDALLDTIAHYVHPLQLLPRIPRDMLIPNLNLKLAKIIRDYILQTSLQQSCSAAVKDDCVSLATSLLSRRRRAIRVGPVPSITASPSQTTPVSPQHAIAAPFLPAAAAPASVLPVGVPSHPYPVASPVLVQHASPPATSSATNLLVNGTAALAARQSCGVCGGALVPSRTVDTLVFFCAHTYHTPCLRALCDAVVVPAAAASSLSLSAAATPPSTAPLWCVLCDPRSSSRLPFPSSSAVTTI